MPEIEEEHSMELRLKALEDSVKEIGIALNILSRDVEKESGNSSKIDALHKRLDKSDEIAAQNQTHMDLKWEQIEETMLTEETLTNILENSFNSHVVGALKRVFQVAMGVAAAAITAWIVHIFDKTS
jgi:hypothetical protein